MTEDLGVVPAFLKVAYTEVDKILVISANEVHHIQECAITLYGVENIRPHLAAGAGIAAVSITAYYLEKKYSLFSRLLGRGSAIFEVPVPTKSFATLKNLISNKTIEKGLQEVFSDIEKHIKEIGGQELIDEIGQDKMKKLKEIQIKNIEMCSKEEVVSILRKKTSEKVEKTPETLVRNSDATMHFHGPVTINNDDREPKMPFDLSISVNPISPNDSIVLFCQEPEVVDRYHVTVTNLADNSSKTFTAENNFVVLKPLAAGSYVIYAQSELNKKFSRKAILPQVVTIGSWENPWRYEPSIAKDSGFGSSRRDDETLSIIGSASEMMPKGERDVAEGRSDVDQSVADLTHISEGSGQKTVNIGGTINVNTGDSDAGATTLWNSEIHQNLQMVLGDMTEFKWKKFLEELHNLGFYEVDDLQYLKDETILASFSEILNRVEILKLKERKLRRMHDWNLYSSGTVSVVNTPMTITTGNAVVDLTRH